MDKKPRGRPRKHRLEGEAAETEEAVEAVPIERPSKGFRAAVALFREAHPDKWDEVALCPTQHGVEIIAEHLERL